jgi:alpha-N-arabinofuranosidase
MKSTASLLLGFVLALPLRAAEEVTVRIDTTAKPTMEVSLKLFGGFLEHMHTCIEGGLWGETLSDRKFSDPATSDAPMGRFWRVLGDPSKVLRTNNSVHISPGGDAVGIELADIYGVPGKRYRGTAFINTERFSGLIEFAYLHGERVLQRGAARVPRVKGRFATQALVAPKEIAPGRMRFIARGDGTFVIGAPTLTPAATTAGVNPAVLPLLKQLNPTWLRWPGGNFAQTYHWRDGIGPRNDRHARPNMAWPKGPVESNDFGTDEFIAVCRALRAEPVICVNVGGNGATAREAAEWVGYCKRRGHKVKYWELGNEIYGHWEVGHTDATTYARNCLDYIEAMKATDKSIKLIAVGHDLNWNRTVLKQIGGKIDYLAQHLYTNHGEFDGLMARPAHYEKFLSDLKTLIRTECPGRDIRVTLNEWNLGGKGFHNWSKAAALFGAGMIHMLARQDGFVDYACSSDLINGWAGGAIQYDKGHAFLTPLGDVLAVYRQRMIGKRAAVVCNNPSLDVLAVRNSTGSKYSVAVLNRDLKSEFSLALDFGKWKPHAAEEWTLAADIPAAKRDFENPGALAPRARKLTKGLHAYRLAAPAHSVTVVEFRR